jgi:hypothetical protein
MATLLNNDFVVKAGLIVEGTGTVSTSTSTAGSVQLASGLSVGKNLIVKSTSTFLGTIEVSKNATFNSGLTVYGNLNAFNISGTISTATNVDGGSPQSLLIQTSPGKTGFVPIGKPYAVLMVSENNTATWSILENIVVGYASTSSNLRFGNFGQIPYQTAPGITGFLDTGTSGYVLIGNGNSAAPSFTNNLTLNKVITSLLTVTNFADITTATISTLNATNATISNNLSVNGTTYLKGDLYVDGTQFSVSSDIVSSGNKIIALSTQTGSDATGNLANHADAADGAGLLIGSSNVNNAWAALTFEYRNGTTEDPGRWVSKNVLLVNTTSDSTSYLTGALQVRGGAGIAGNVFINNTADIKYVKVSGLTEASSVTSGALTVSGGVGIKKNLYVGGDVYIGGLIQNVSIVTATFTTIKVTGTNVAVTVTNSAYIGNTLTVKTIIVNSTQSSIIDVTNNAVYVAGGVGIGGSIYAGDIYSNGAKVSVQGSSVATITAGTDTAINTNTGAVVIWNNSTLQSVTSRGSSTTNAVSINNSTGSTGTNNGALKVSGGVGVGGNLNVGGNIKAATTSYINNFEIVTTATIGSYEAKFASQTTGTLHIINSATSFDYVSGALIVDGGVGIGGDINVHGSFSVGGSLKSENFYGNLQGIASTASTVVTVSESGNGDAYFLTFVEKNNNANFGPIAETLKTSSNLKMRPDTGYLFIGPDSLANSQLTINTFNNANNGITALSLIGPNSNQYAQDIRIIRSTQNSNSTPYYGANITLSGLYDVVLQEYNGGLLFFNNAQGDFVNGMTLNSNNQLLINYADPDAIGVGTLNVNGAGYFNGVVTATTFIGDVTGNASTASSISVVATKVDATYYPTLVNVNSQTANNLSIYTTSSLSINPLTGKVSISSTVASTSTTTGGLTVAGGVGIGGNIWANGIYIAQTQFINFGGASGTRIYRDGARNGLDLQVDSVSRLFIHDTDGVVTISSTASSTSTNTGALRVTGGVGIGGALYVANTSYIAGAQIVTSATISSFISTGSVSKLIAGTDTAITTSTGEVVIWNTSTLQSITSRGSSTNRAILISNAASSTSTNSGALQVVGGVGVGGAIYVDGNVTVGGTIYGNNNRTLALRTNSLDGIDISPSINITAGNVATASSVVPAGSINLTGGNGTGSNNAGGSVNITGGVGSTFGSGSVNITGGAISGSGIGDYAGDVTITGGDGNPGGMNAGHVYIGNKTTKPYGSVYIAAGSAGKSAQLNVTGGDGIIAATANQITLVSTATTGTINNMSIGATTAATGRFTTATITSTATSTSTITGALVVTGGVGIGGALYTGGNIYANGSKVVTEATAGGVSTLNALTGTVTISVGTDTAVYINTSTKDVVIWNTSTLQTVTGRGSSTNVAISITNTASSTSTNTGALRVTGGVGIGGALWVGSNTNIGTFNGSTFTNITTLQVTNSLAITNYSGNQWLVMGNQDTTVGANTPSAIRASNGQLSFGVGSSWTSTWTSSASRVPVGTFTEYVRFDTTGSVFIYTTTNATSTNSGALQVVGGVGIGGSVYIGDTVRIQTTTPTTGTNTGALTVTGGVGIGGDLYVGGTITANIVTIQYTTITTSLIKTDDVISTYNTTISTSTITGALTVAGGVGIGGAAYIGTASYIAGSTILTEANFSKYGVSSIIAGTDTVINTSTGAVTIWNSSTLQSITGRGSTTSNAISITSATNSTGTDTGALTVVGGVGIGGVVWANQLRQTSSSVAIGSLAGQTNQGVSGVAIGNQAGNQNQGASGVAIGPNAGRLGQLTNAIAIGSSAGDSSQQTKAIAIGTYAAALNQGTGSISIGWFTGYNYQGAYAIAIGYNAAYYNQTTGSIVLSAGTASITSASNVGLYISPIRGDSSTSATTWLMMYNTSTNEITTANSIVSLSVTSSIASTSTNSGALTVIGGVGIGGALYVANTSYIAGAQIITTATISSYAAAASNASTGTTSTFFINNATQSTSTNTGALTVTGGAGIGGNLNVGGSTSTFGGSIGVNVPFS